MEKRLEKNKGLRDVYYAANNDALTHNVKYTVFNGHIKFSLQLINPNELPYQIRLFLAYILPEPQHSYCKCSGLLKRAAIFLCPPTRDSFKTVYEDSDSEGGPILC